MVDVVRVGFALGAEVVGLDLRARLDLDTRASLRRALVEHQVLILRDQRLAPEELLTFAAAFGELRAPRDEGEALPGHPHVIRLANDERSRTRYYGSVWHSDGLAFTERPDHATFLHCVRCPRIGGDTAFANQYLAYEALSIAYRKMLSELMWHVPRMPSIAHPVVRVHAETGRQHLFLAAGARLCGMTRDESRGIVDHLFEVQTTDRFVYRHRWQENDVVLWENSTTLHRKIGDNAPDEPRVMHRTATVGDIVGARVDPRTGRPAGASCRVEANDVLRLARPIAPALRVGDGGEKEVVVRAGSRELAYPGAALEFLSALAKAERFVASSATEWSSNGEQPWSDVSEALSVLVADGLITHDVFGDAHRLSFR